MSAPTPQPASLQHRVGIPVLLALVLYILDQATKWWAAARVPFEHEEPIIPGFFHLGHYGNTGAAFSMFPSGNLFFLCLSLATLIGLLIACVRNAFPDPINRTAVGLLMGGILGNVTDRILHGHVIDFLVFYLHIPFANPWPAFNVADSCIFIAVGLFLLAAWREPRAAKKEPKTLEAADQA